MRAKYPAELITNFSTKLEAYIREYFEEHPIYYDESKWNWKEETTNKLAYAFEIALLVIQNCGENINKEVGLAPDTMANTVDDTSSDTTDGAKT